MFGGVMSPRLGHQRALRIRSSSREVFAVAFAGATTVAAILSGKRAFAAATSEPQTWQASKTVRLPDALELALTLESCDLLSACVRKCDGSISSCARIGHGHSARKRKTEISPTSIKRWRNLAERSGVQSVLELAAGDGMWSSELVELAERLGWSLKVVCTNLHRPPLALGAGPRRKGRRKRYTYGEGDDSSGVARLEAVAMDVSGQDSGPQSISNFACTHEDAFDLVVMRNAVCHCKGNATCGGFDFSVDSARRVTSSLRAILRPGGAAVFTNPHGNSISAAWLQTFKDACDSSESQLLATSDMFSGTQQFPFVVWYPQRPT